MLFYEEMIASALTIFFQKFEKCGSMEMGL